VPYEPETGSSPTAAASTGLDDEIARLLGERFEVCRQIARYKRAHEIPMMQPHRVEAVRERYLARGAEAGLPAEFAGRLPHALDRRHLQGGGRADGGAGCFRGERG
jgi:chorismate mutase